MKTLTTLFIAVLASMLSITSFAVPKLNSLPSASATIYLDFDGHTVTNTLWNGGNPIFCDPTILSDAEITEVFNRVAEDYRPFDVNITTDSTKFLSTPLVKRIRVIITPTSSWKAGVGGVSFIGSFTWGDDTPAFVFSDRLGSNNTKSIAECCSHESGHTLGLSHQSKYDNNCTLTESYNTGEGSGEISWAPIMGNSYTKNMTGWNNGPIPTGCSNTQDNLGIIATSNGFGYRADDYSDSMDVTAYTPAGSSFNISGIIGSSNDKDVLRFNLINSGLINITATPFNVGSANNGANLDIKMLLYDQNKNLIRTYDPSNTMSVTIDTTLNAGTYYFVIDGTGNSYASNYGSIGSYSITGFRNTLVIKQVALTGKSENNNHNLNWTITSDDQIRSIEIEYSNDGSNFTTLTTVPSNATNYSYKPWDEKVKYYRVKATSILNQTVLSNIISLKGVSKVATPFVISTFVTSQLSVSAPEDFQFKIMDMNGRVLQMGRGIKGNNSYSLNNQVSGVYVIQMFGTTIKQTERYVKQ
jgi:hypothetical protein